MTNAELFKQTFGRYATDVWALPEDEFLEWLNADVQQKTGRWIPCSERLPENDDEVLVTDDACGLAVVGIDWFDSDSGRWWCSQNVTAWLPLPEPYVPDTNDGKMKGGDNH